MTNRWESYKQGAAERYAEPINPNRLWRTGLYIGAFLILSINFAMDERWGWFAFMLFGLFANIYVLQDDTQRLRKELDVARRRD